MCSLALKWENENRSDACKYQYKKSSRTDREKTNGNVRLERRLSLKPLHHYMLFLPIMNGHKHKESKGHRSPTATVCLIFRSPFDAGK